MNIFEISDIQGFSLVRMDRDIEGSTWTFHYVREGRPDDIHWKFSVTREIVEHVGFAQQLKRKLDADFHHFMAKKAETETGQKDLFTTEMHNG